MLRRTLRFLVDHADETTAIPKRKLQVAIIGSGPSGCYVAHHLLKGSQNVHVDVYEQLPVPYGLSRYGVAPDHPEVKNVEQTFTKMFESGRATFIGNVLAGKEVRVEELLATYSAVVVATGAASDTRLRIPGEKLFNVISAKKIVDWYNTLPFPYGEPMQEPFPMEKIKSAVIIGNGNVAMDVARAFAVPYKHWCPTDMNCVAIKQLLSNRLEKINIVGRRGVEHGAFTIKEFREFTEFKDNVFLSVDDFVLEEKLKLLSANELRAKTRLLSLIHQYTPSGRAAALARQQAEAEEAAKKAENDPQGSNKAKEEPKPTVENTEETPRYPEYPFSTPYGVPYETPTRVPGNKRHVHFRYGLKPIMILPRWGDSRSAGGVLFEVNPAAAQGGGLEAGGYLNLKDLQANPGLATVDLNAIPKPLLCESEDVSGKAKHFILPCDLVIRSVGYQVDPFPGVPYDSEKNCIANSKGRVTGIPRLYCSGWAKRGPKGVILQTLSDAQETAKAILADIDRDDLEPPQGTTNNGKFDLVETFIEKQVYPVTFNFVRKLWEVEKERGLDLGKHSEKIPTVRQMVDIVMGGRIGHRASQRFRQFAPDRPPGVEHFDELLDDETMLFDGDQDPEKPDYLFEALKRPASDAKNRARK
jgi:adrenodoxin-NADP+ reductase